MKRHAVLATLAIAVIGMSAVMVWAAGGGRGAGARGGLAGQGLGVAALAAARDPLTLTVQALGDLNLTPQFNLSVEQKTRIQAIRDQAAAVMEKWRTDNQAALQALAEEARDARGGGAEAMRDPAQRRQTLMATAPNTQEYADQIKAVLTPEQLKQLEERLAQTTRPGRGLGAAGGQRGAGAAGAGAGQRARRGQ